MVGEISSMPKSFLRDIEFFLSDTGYFADFVELLCGVIPQNYTKMVIFSNRQRVRVSSLDPSS